ncbi:type VI secretion system-associated protein TagF [Rhodospirillaceae bacterium SYSU D60014]|uniref:type VI secretion system-associated protein TagF n=1 Tax=Virgifigura deserti TaxID=2268457 RepID=UPI000E6703E0
MPGLALRQDNPQAGPGFYGKLPARGDFMTRRLPRPFIEPWDAWLQAAISCSREQLGADWLPAYLTCPVWHFVLGPGLCGDHVAAGVLMPSVDRVGRYFPLVLAAPLPDCGNPAALAAGASGWFDGLEALALSALEDDFDIERFDADLRAMGFPTAVGKMPSSGGPMAGGWRIAMLTTDPAGSYPDLLDRLLRLDSPTYSLWWTAHAEERQRSLLVCRGLPHIGSYAALLDGCWERSDGAS